MTPTIESGTQLGYSIDEIRLKVRTLINDTFNKDAVCQSPNDILLNSVSMDIISAYHKMVIIRTRIGFLWEHIFCLFGYNKLRKGADIINHDKKVIIELKNKTSSDNKSSRIENTSKLIRSIKPGYKLIYGIVNDNKSKDQDLDHEGTSYRLLTGALLLQFIIGDQWKDIIKIIQQEFNSIVQFI